MASTPKPNTALLWLKPLLQAAAVLAVMIAVYSGLLPFKSFLSVRVASANSCQSNVSSGNYNAAGSWTNCGGNAPNNTDTIEILNGNTITVNVSTTTAAVTVDVGGILTFSSASITLTDTGNYTNNGTISGGGNLTMSGNGVTLGGTGNFTGTGKFTVSTTTIASTASTTISAQFIISTRTTVTNNGAVTMASSTGGFTCTTACAWVQGANSTLNYQSSVSFNVAALTLTATASGNTVNYNYAGNQTCKTTTYYNLIFSGSGAKTCATTAVNNNLSLLGSATWTTSSAIGVSGALSIGSGTTLTLGSTSTWTLSVTGTTTVSGTLALANTGLKTFTGPMIIDTGSISNSSTGGITFKKGITNNSTGSVSFGTSAVTFSTNSQSLGGSQTIPFGGAVTVTGIVITNNTKVTVAGNFTGTGGWTQGSGSELDVAGGTTNALALTGALDFHTNGNTVNYNGGAQTATPTSYSLLELSGSGTKTLTNVATVGGDFDIYGTAAATLAKNFTVGGNLNVGDGTNGAGLTTGNFTLAVTGLTTVAAGSYFNHAGNAAVSLNGGLTVNGCIATSAACTTASSGTGQINVTGNVTGSGVINLSGNTFEQDGTGNFGTSGLTGWNFKNLNIGNSTAATTTVISSATTTVSGALTIGSTSSLNAGSGIFSLTGGGSPFVVNTGGSFTAGSSTVSFNAVSGTTTVPTSISYYNLTFNPASGTPEYRAAAGTLTVNGNLITNGAGNELVNTLASGTAVSIAGDLTIGSGDTFSAPSSSSFSLAGDFINNGTFSHNNGTLTFNGGLQYVTGTSTFYNLNVSLGSGNAGPSAVSLIAHSSGYINNTAATVTTGAMNCTGANFLVAVVAAYNNSVVTGASVSDSSGNTWAHLAEQVPGTANRHETIYYAKAASVSSSQTVTFHDSGNDYMGIAAACYSGVDTASPLDQSNGYSPTTSGYTFQPGSITPSQNNELLVAGIMNDNGNYSSIDSGFTKEDNTNTASAAVGAYLADQIQTTAAAKNPTWTFTPGNVDTSPNDIASFKLLTVSTSTNVSFLTAGTSTIAGTLTVSGGATLNAGQASLVLTGTGTPLNVLGTFTASSSTVSFQGTSGTTTVPALSYNNLDFSPPSGSANFKFTAKTNSSGPVISRVQTANYVGSTACEWVSSCSVTFGSNVTAGDFIAVFVTGDWAAPVASSVTDSLSNTYQLAASVNASTNESYNNVATQWTYYAQNVSGGADTITFNTDAQSYIVITAVEYSGIATSSALDQITSYRYNYQNHGFVGTPTYTSGYATTTQAYELLVGVVGANNSGYTDTYTPDAGWNKVAVSEDTGAGNYNQEVQDQIVSAIGTYKASGADSANPNVQSTSLSTFKGASTISTNSSTTIAGNLTIGGAGSATVDDNSNNLPLAVSGNFSIGSNDTFSAPSSSSFSLAGNFSSSGTFTHNNGTLTMTGTSQGITGSPTFYNLTFAGTATDTLTSAATATVANLLTVNSGTVLNAGPSTFALTATGMPFVVNGAFVASSSTISYQATSGTTTPTNVTYNNLDFSPQSGSASFTLPSSGWYNPSWLYRKAITINHNDIASSTGETYANFPVLVSIPSDADLYSHASSSGADILFTNASGTKLNHEIESYATNAVAATSSLIAWVNVGSAGLSTSSDTTLYMYYGNSAAASQQNATGTWNSNYLGVWHLPNGSSLNVNDSTSKGNNGTNHSAAAASGVIDGDASFNGSAYISPTTTGFSQFVNNGPFTVSVWAKATNTANRQAIMGDWNSGGTGDSFAMEFGGYGQTAGHLTTLVNGATYLDSGVSASNGTFYNIVVTIGGGNRIIYVNGISKNSDTNTTLGTGSHLTFGQGGDYTGINLTGAEDEIRISNIARSADWIATEYNNQSAPSVFETLGSQAAVAAAIKTIAVTGNLTMGGAGSATVNDYVNNIPLAVSGSVAIGGNDALLAPPSASFTVGGNFTNNGTFAANGGTVQIGTSSATSVISGTSTTFSNLTLPAAGETVQFQAQSNSLPLFTIAGSLNATGTSGSLINIQSTVTGTQWLVHFAVAQSGISYANIKDSGCDAGSALVTETGKNNTNGGNNGTCWQLASVAVVSSGGGGGSGGLSVSNPTGASGGGSQVSGGGSGGGSSGGGISVVAAVNNYTGNNGTTLNSSAGLNIVSGDLIYVSAYLTNSGCGGLSMAVSDTIGNVFKLVGSELTSGWSSLQCLAQWYATSTAANASDIITITYGSSGVTPAGLEAIQIRGANTTAALDQNFSDNDGTAGRASSRTSPSFTTTAANEILVMSTGLDGSSSITAGSCAGSTCTIPSNGSSSAGAIEYQIVSSIQTSQTMSLSFSSSPLAQLVGATFVASGSGSSGSTQGAGGDTGGGGSQQSGGGAGGSGGGGGGGASP